MKLTLQDAIALKQLINTQLSAYCERHGVELKRYDRNPQSTFKRLVAQAGITPTELNAILAFAPKRGVSTPVWRYDMRWSALEKLLNTLDTDETAFARFRPGHCETYPLGEDKQTLADNEKQTLALFPMVIQSCMARQNLDCLALNRRSGIGLEATKALLTGQNDTPQDALDTIQALGYPKGTSITIFVETEMALETRKDGRGKSRAL